MTMIERVAEILRLNVPGSVELAGIKVAEKLILAVSGGPDSLCLLHLLCQQHLYDRQRLIVGHLNHNLRDTAEKEAAFVMDFATGLGLRGVTKTVDVAWLAQSEGLSIEEAGRQARYAFLAKIALENNARFILTGHNADDQVETILMHFLRGSGPAGLGGMKTTSPLPGTPGLTVIRPLMKVSRDEIEAYCSENNLKPVTDETNQEIIYYRNRLRHKLIPLLEEYNPGIRQRLQNMATIIAGEDALLREMIAQEWDSLIIGSGPGFVALDRWLIHAKPVALQRRIIRQALLSLKPNLRNVGFRTTEQAREVAYHGEVGSESTLPTGILMRVDYDQILFWIPGATVPLPDMPQLETPTQELLPIPGKFELAGGWCIEATLLEDVETRDVSRNEDPKQAYLSLTQLDGIILRPREPGERFRPLGMASGSTKVSRSMIDLKIPKALRAKWPIVADKKGLLWLVGHQIDERAKIGAGHAFWVHLRLIKQVDDQ